jgi:hypothetical protein
VLPDYQGNESPTPPIPATLIIVERDGFIRARLVDPDFQRRTTVEELIDALKKASNPCLPLRQICRSGLLPPKTSFDNLL